MLSRLIDRWMCLHWLTRFSVLGAFGVLLWWQTRHTFWFGFPQYGWPISYEYVLGYKRGRSYPMFFVDFVVWLTLAGSTGYVIEKWWRQPSRFRLNRSRALAFSSVLLVLCAFRCIEAYFRMQADNDCVCPKYGYVDLGRMELWLDIGLFTDPIYCWPLIRIVVIGTVGCAIYAISLAIYRIVRCGVRWSTHAGPTHDRIVIQMPLDERDRGPRDPNSGVIIWVLFAVVALYMVWLAVPPMVMT